MTHKSQTIRCDQKNQVFVQTPNDDIVASDVSELATIALLLVAGYNVTQRFNTGRNTYLTISQARGERDIETQ